jgi:hypothetical protein
VGGRVSLLTIFCREEFAGRRERMRREEEASERNYERASIADLLGSTVPEIERGAGRARGLGCAGGAQFVCQVDQVERSS